MMPHPHDLHTKWKLQQENDQLKRRIKELELLNAPKNQAIGDVIAELGSDTRDALNALTRSENTEDKYC